MAAPNRSLLSSLQRTSGSYSECTQGEIGVQTNTVCVRAEDGVPDVLSWRTNLEFHEVLRDSPRPPLVSHAGRHGWKITDSNQRPLDPPGHLSAESE